MAAEIGSAGRHGREVRRRRRHGGVRCAALAGRPRGTSPARSAFDAAAPRRTLRRRPLTLRIGVNTGEVVVGQPREGSSFVSGDAVNVAARLEQAAGPGEILVGERTASAVRGAFELGEATRRRGEGQGRRRRVPATRPRALAHAATGRWRTAGGVRRAASRRWTCCERRTRVRERHDEPQLVTILGEAGIGKTTLARELWGWLGSQSPEPLRRTGRCLSYGQGITYVPVGEIVREHLGLVEGGSARRDPASPRAARDAGPRARPRGPGGPPSAGRARPAASGMGLVPGGARRRAAGGRPRRGSPLGRGATSRTCSKPRSTTCAGLCSYSPRHAPSFSRRDPGGAFVRRRLADTVARGAVERPIPNGWSSSSSLRRCPGRSGRS